MCRSFAALSALALVSAVSTAALASHWTISGGIEGRTSLRFNLAECVENDEYKFVWTANQIQQPLRLTNDYRTEIRTSNDSSQACDYQSTGDNCTVVSAASSWTPVSPATFSATLALQSHFFADGGCIGTGSRRAVLFLKDEQPLIPGGTVEPVMRGEILFNFDFDPPAAPAPPTVSTGDQGLNVSWEGSTRDAGVSRKVRVYFSAVPGLLTGTPNCDSGSYRTSCAFVGPFTGGQARISGLTNGETVYVAIAELDDYDNLGPVSLAVPGSPQDVSDYFEHYANSGGTEKGGFCFIATAAFGSYWHPLVSSLRRFRDQVLAQSAWGRDFISFYYSWSPALAEVIEDTPHLRALFRIVLAPIAVAAWFVVDLVWWQQLSLLAFAWLALRFLRRFFRRVRSLARSGRTSGGLRVVQRIPAAVWVLAVLGGWMLFDAPAARAETESPRNFFLELKVGGIAPEMDRRAGPVGTLAPFAKIFGDGTRTMSGLELEYQIIKDKGSFGVSAAMNFFQAVGRGLLADSAQASPETTVLNVMPFQVNAVYRWDVPMRKHGVPFVPYVKAGFDWYLWWILNGAGNVSSFTDKRGEKRRGLGGTFGIHASLGLQFQLDVIDRRMQRAFDEEVGVNHSYLFAEVVFSRVDDFNQGSLNFSAIYFFTGLALEF